MATQRVIVRPEKQALSSRDEGAELERLKTLLSLPMRVVSFRAYRNPSLNFTAKLRELCRQMHYSLSEEAHGKETYFHAEKMI